ncbi:hypothetical protein TWF481_002637 [Arthrobotrys musiformis]|uniref:Nucleoside phosphorylase domain-containing protein n=1 Tax=Arthrobotrys musiformis TaxID=47236 RepID=A0AAV9VSU1_9PEZI
MHNSLLSQSTGSSQLTAINRYHTARIATYVPRILFSIMSRYDTANDEFYILRSLAWSLKGRLTRPKDRNESKCSELTSYCALIETKLRASLMRDFDTRLFTPPADELFKSLIELLESLVNEGFIATCLVPPRPPHMQDSSDHYSTQSVPMDYPKIRSVIKHLRQTEFDKRTENFELFYSAEQCEDSPTIFYVGSAELAKRTLKTISEICDSLHDMLDSSGTPKRKRPLEAENFSTNPTEFNDADILFRKHVTAVFNGLHRHLTCASHQVQLRWPDERCDKVDLFLSKCSDISTWHEVQCLCYFSNESNRRINNLCEALQQFQNFQIQVTVENRRLYPEGVYFTEPKASYTSHLVSSSPRTLEELVKTNVFYKMTTDDYLKGSPLPAKLFNRADRCTLALHLSWCFLNFFDASFMTRNWSSANIAFLVPPNHEIQEGALYIRCSLEAACREEVYSAGHPVLTSLAKTLFEIYFGDISAELETHMGSHIKIWGELCRMVSVAQYAEGCSYLEAVQGCLYLHNDWIEAKKSGKDADSKLRELIYKKVVSHLVREHESFENSAKKRQRVEKDSVRITHAVRSTAIGRDSGSRESSLPKPLISRDEQQKSMEYIEENKFNNTECRIGLQGTIINYGHINITDDQSLSEKLKPRKIIVPQGLYKSSYQDHKERNPLISRDQRTVAIVCALTLEADAVRAVFDDTYDCRNQIYDKHPEDWNTYTIGRIGKYNVVLCHLPDVGISNAAIATSRLRISYPRVELTLVVGVCGAVPSPGTGEIFLGDIIISDGLLKYGSGNVAPYPEIQERLNKLKNPAERTCFQRNTSKYLGFLQNVRKSDYSYPGIDNDKLFPDIYTHKPYGRDPIIQCNCTTCSQKGGSICDEIRKMDCSILGCVGELRQRVRLEEDKQEKFQPRLHIGKIASGDIVMTSGKDRNALAERENVIGFEMEGAGVWDNGSCLIIKGVSDYADSHKSNSWQLYAAATAACGAKAFLEFWFNN